MAKSEGKSNDKRIRAVYNIAILVLLLVTASYAIANFHIKGDGLNDITGQAVAQQAYQKGVTDTQLLVTQEIIKQLNEQGFVEVQVPTENGQTVTIRLGILQQPAQ
jgi:hypothetical protein